VDASGALAACHARIVSVDTKDAAGMPAFKAVYIGPIWFADDIGTIPTLMVFPRPDGFADDGAATPAVGP